LQLIHLTLLTWDYVVQMWKHHIQINEEIPSKGEQSPTNNGPLHKHRQNILKRWPVKQILVWCIVYEHRFANVSVRIHRKKKSRFLWKVGLLGLCNKKCAFCMQIFWLSILEGLMKIRFHAKFYPNNFKYCDVGLWTKYIYGIALHISPIILLIEDWKWWCKMELFNIRPFKACVNKNSIQIKNNMQWIHLWWRQTTH
jgi:hypothetical protein